MAAIRSAKLWINIDHHPSNPGYGDIVYIDPTAPATGQILFELIKSQSLPIDREIAENLYVAISTDTGSFQYPNTTTRTFEIAAELVRAGDRCRTSESVSSTKIIRAAASNFCAILLDTMRFEARRAGGEIQFVAATRAKTRRATGGQRRTDRPSPRHSGCHCRRFFSKN